MWLRVFGTTLLGRLSHRLLWTKHAALPRTKPLLQLSKIAQWSGHLQQGRLSSHLGSGSLLLRASGCASIATPWRTAPRWSCRRSLATSVRDQSLAPPSQPFPDTFPWNQGPWSTPLSTRPAPVGTPPPPHRASFKKSHFSSFCTR